MSTHDEKVRHLLEMAGLSLQPEEVAEFAASYEGFRAGVDALYEVPLPDGEEPQTIFTPIAPVGPAKDA